MRQLLSVPGKIFASVVLVRMKKAVDNALRQKQVGFRPGISCNDQISTLRRILETVPAGRNPTISNFIDFPKAFDSVNRPALWKILRMYGFPEQVISILQNLYQYSKRAVRTNVDTSEWFCHDACQPTYVLEFSYAHTQLVQLLFLPTSADAPK